MERALIHINNMILIGATGQNSGKTTFAAGLIQRWRDKFPIIALKITTVNHKDAYCVRGGAGCGACASLSGEFELTEETDPFSTKDTSVLLAAGAHKVYWLKCMKAHLREAIRHFLAIVPKDTLILCESNSLRNVVQPGLFVMLQNSKHKEMKPSAEEVMKNASLLIDTNFAEGITQSISRVQIACSVNGSELLITI